LPDDGNAYRFEYGGGHWIFGVDRELARFFSKHISLLEYKRKSSVFFRETGSYVPYPLQNHLRYLESEIASRALSEIPEKRGSVRTMKNWLATQFGPTLCGIFFYPFHELYTCGLYSRIAPQDEYKSPSNVSHAVKGASENVSPVGYNVSFFYPAEGLDTLARKIAAECDVRYNKRVVKIDPYGKEIFFKDASRLSYDKLISTLPLNRTIEMAGIEISPVPDPYTSVLVLNIGAKRGPGCPDDHWLYVPDSKSKFHRVGFYSNVDRSFLPVSSRKNNDRVGIYVEKAFAGGVKAPNEEIERYSAKVLEELQVWGFIEDVEVADPTWIDVAYTWTWPGSRWKQIALAEAAGHDIFPIGRYGRWRFQGIAESLKEGLSLRSSIQSKS
jgi:protoporphyrinogen oxidase